MGREKYELKERITNRKVGLVIYLSGVMVWSVELAE